MKKLKKSIASLCLVLLVVLPAFRFPAFSDYYPVKIEDRWVYYVYGGAAYIPKGFSAIHLDHSNDYVGYYYDFYDDSQEMLISLSESLTEEYPVSEQDLINVMYSSYKRELPRAVYDAKDRDWFELSGYDDDSIYYIRCKRANHAFYTVWFYYPTVNRRVCDRIVEQVCNDFSTDWPRAARRLGSYPSPADLDAIRSDAKYPNYSWMYLDHYEYATMNRDAYCFKDPDTDVWRRGNFFPVRKNTPVIILAKSEGYACVILDGTNLSGWINLNYMTIDSRNWR